jgi:hypothetical protein
MNGERDSTTPTRINTSPMPNDLALRLLADARVEVTEAI